MTEPLTYTLIDSANARSKLTREQVEEVLRVWETPPQLHAVFGRFEGHRLLFSGPCEQGIMFVCQHEVDHGWVEVKQIDIDHMRAWVGLLAKQNKLMRIIRAAVERGDARARVLADVEEVIRGKG